MSQLSTNIRARREALGYSQQELARIAGVSQTTIDKLERGITKKSRFIIYIAVALKCSIADLDPDYLVDMSFTDRELALSKVTVTDEMLEAALRSASRKDNVGLFASEQETFISSINPDLPFEEGVFSLGTRPIDFVPAAAGLYDGETSFAVYIDTTVMSPEFDQGDVAIFNRKHPIIKGATCFFERQKDGTRLCTFGRLKDDSDGAWTLVHMGTERILVLKKNEWSAFRAVAKHYRR